MAKQSSQQASQQAPVINGKFKVQKTRQITPDRKPAQNGDSSRDELAKTMSSHNARRRKRPLDEDSGSEDDQSMAPNSPHKAATKPKPLKKPATNSAKVAASQPPASKPFSKPVMKQTSRSASQPISQPISQPASQPISRSTPQTVPTKRVLGTTRTSNLPPTKTTASRISEGTLKASAGNARNGDNDDEEAGAEERSRSNSTVTLMPSSNGASQSHGESQLQVPELEKVGFDKGKLKKTGKAEKNESAAMAELNILCRRYFLTYLSNTYVDEPIRAVFPGMKIDHPVYKDAKRRVQSSYKTWKGQVLVAALGWVQRWISSARGARLAYLSNLSTFADIKGEIHANFDDSWLETVFKFGIDAVDFEDISLMGLRFLKYAFLQLTTHQRLTHLHHQDVHDSSLFKYTRQHLLDIFDALHQRIEFKDQSIDSCPERLIPRSMQKKRPQKVDINEDSDASVLEAESAGEVGEVLNDAGDETTDE